jgi:hypothetical protein
VHIWIVQDLVQGLGKEVEVAVAMAPTTSALGAPAAQFL